MSGSTCHTRSLIALFGTKENDSEYESNWSCGHCTFCERGARPIQLFPAEYPAGSINEASFVFVFFFADEIRSMFSYLFLSFNKLITKSPFWIVHSCGRMPGSPLWNKPTNKDGRAAAAMVMAAVTLPFASRPASLITESLHTC